MAIQSFGTTHAQTVQLNIPLGIFIADAPTNAAATYELRWDDAGPSGATLEVGDEATFFIDNVSQFTVTYQGLTDEGTPVFTDPGDNGIVLTNDINGFSQLVVSNIQALPLACFLTGTLIATPGGERAVETLAIGDMILTSDGRAVPVKWMGRQHVRNSVFLSAKLQPVMIGAGALGDGLPHTDLYLSANHGMIWQGMVVNAGALVNGTTIRFVPLAEMPGEFTYFHIETEAHEEVLANGAPAETFVDYVGRSVFDNHQEYLDLYGAERIIPEMKRPRLSAQRMLPDDLRNRLGLPAYGAEIEAEAAALLHRLKAA